MTAVESESLTFVPATPRCALTRVLGESAATVKEILLHHHMELVKQREEIEHVGCRSRRECCRLAMDLPVP
jgi:hypothetical protein